VTLPTIQFMAIELTRLALGFVILLFHRPIADFILERDRQLVVLFRQRGVPLPQAPTTETGRDIYFVIGTFIILYEIARIWMMLPPR
jgi:hypothetical protein